LKGDAMAISVLDHRAGQGLEPVPGADLATQASLRFCYRASVLLGLLLAAAAGIGLLVPGIYRGNTGFATAAFRGTDLVSLVVAVPTLAVSLSLARRGSTRALLVWLGTLAYVGYTYLYSFAIAWNRLFLVYVALLSLSGFTIVRALLALNPNQVAARFAASTPVRGVGAFLWVIGAMLGLMELAQVLPALITGAVPEIVIRSGHPTGVIYIADLGLVVPLMLLVGGWIRARRPWGYVAAAILLVKGVAEGLALLSSNLFVHLHGQPTDGPLMGLWALIAVGSLAVLLRYLRSMEAWTLLNSKRREHPAPAGGRSA
jgi:hypothetical protein